MRKVVFLCHRPHLMDSQHFLSIYPLFLTLPLPVQTFLLPWLMCLIQSSSLLRLVITKNVSLGLLLLIFRPFGIAPIFSPYHFFFFLELPKAASSQSILSFASKATKLPQPPRVFPEGFRAVSTSSEHPFLMTNLDTPLLFPLLVLQCWGSPKPPRVSHLRPVLARKTSLKYLSLPPLKTFDATGESYIPIGPPS